VSEDVKINPEQIIKTVAELSTVVELVKRLGDLRTELHELLTRKYNICRVQSPRDRLFYSFTVHLNNIEHVKEVSVARGDIVVTNTRFSAVEFEPDKVSLRDRSGSAVRIYELCKLSTSDVIELAINIDEVIYAVKQELEPMIKRFEKFIEAVKTLVTALEMTGEKT
jgi:hypothetical protein